MHDQAAGDALVQHLGLPKAEYLADLAGSGFFGIPERAHLELAASVVGFTGKYADSRYARDALQDLMARFPE